MNLPLPVRFQVNAPIQFLNIDFLYLAARRKSLSYFFRDICPFMHEKRRVQNGAKKLKHGEWAN